MLASFPLSLAVGTVLGFLSGLGVGGGSLLLLWLTLVLNPEPTAARAVNLWFFLPAALVACHYRKKEGTLEIQKMVPAIAAGCIGAILGTKLGAALDTQLLKKAFGILLLVTGIREIFWKSKKKAP
jgi:uncharacterized membrane protein YfcA